MTDQPAVPIGADALLRTAYQAALEEYNRICKLVNAKPGDPLPEPLADRAEILNKRFQSTSDRVRRQLDLIQKRLDDPALERLDEAWDTYAELKSEMLPALASELLAVIGGVYLIESRLDDLRSNQPSDPSEPSFSQMARLLVHDLNGRSSMGWESILIVGEEYLGHSEADIIRLRFPACDIWNLPFTAHEYGYLGAFKDRAEIFKDLRDEVRNALRPDRLTFGLTRDRTPYLAEAVNLWDAYEALKSNDEREDFVKRHRKEILILQRRQVAHLCRLFADAFAVWFAGPAYLYALLYLRFVPDETLDEPMETLPPFQARYMICLEVLQALNTDRDLYPSGTGDLPFAGVVEEEIAAHPEAIPPLWRSALLSSRTDRKAAEVGRMYTAMREKYGTWLKTILRSLKEDLQRDVGKTYADWAQALALAPQMLGVAQAPPDLARFAVLNAAWLARHQRPDQVETIEDNARRLLAAAPAAQTASTAAARSSVSAVASNDVKIVKDALDVIDFVAADEFETMAQANRFESSRRIQQRLKEYEAEDGGQALNAFRRLVLGTGGGPSPAPVPAATDGFERRSRPAGF